MENEVLGKRSEIMKKTERETEMRLMVQEMYHKYYYMVELSTR